MKITDLQDYHVVATGLPQKEDATALQTAKDVGIGVVKGVGSTVKGLADLGRPIQAALDPTKTLAEYNADTSGKITEEQVKATNPAQQAGKVIEFGLEVLFPASRVSKALGFTSKVGQVSSKVGTGVANKAKSAVTAITPKSEDIMQRVARIPKGAQAKFKQTSGESVGKYLTRRNIYGSTEEISQQLFNRFQQSKSVADEALAQLPGKYTAQPIETALKELMGKVERTSSPGAPDADFGKVAELMQKYNEGGLSMTEINEVKRIFERRVRLDFLKTNVPEDVTRATNLDNALREWQFSKADALGLKNLGEINKETQLAKQLLDALGKENAGNAGNNAVSLTDWVLLSNGDPTAVSAYLAKKAFSSEGIQSAIAKKLYKGNTQGVPIRLTEVK